MSNHFHILVEATGRPEERPSEESLVEHVEATLGQTVADQYRWRLDLCRAGKLEDDARQAKLAEDDADAAAEWIPTYHQLEFDKVLADIWRRMYDVSCFVQSLKQQFTNWYNKRTGRSGTLWESRFRSTVVQGGAAVTEMAAYIDLNPVRAGLVDDPKDYRWSQYGAAIGGADAQAREGLETVVAKYSSLTEEEQVDWNRVQARYRILMYRRGLQVTLPNGQVEGVFEPEEVDKIWAEGGKISGISYAATRVRYFTDGLVIGSKEYVDKLFRENRSCFGKNRKSGARTMQGADWGDLRSMRDLQKTPLGEA